MKGPELLGALILGLAGSEGALVKARGGEACNECMHALHRLVLLGPAEAVAVVSASASCTWWAVWAILRATCVLDAWFPAAGRPAEPPCTPHLASATCGAPVGRQMPAGMHVQAPSREPGGVFASHRSFTTIPGAERGACITLLLWTPPPGAGGLGRRSIRLKRPAGLSEGHGQEEAGAELGRPGLAGPGRQPRRPAAPARDSVSDASCVGSGGRHPALHGLQPTPTSVQNLGAPSFCRPVEVLRQLQSGLSPGGALASEPLSLRCAVGGQAGRMGHA